MKVIYKNKETFLLRFEKGKEFVSALLDFCEKNAIHSAWIQGLGAADNANISYYNLATQKYIPKEFHEEFEIVSLTGNIAQFDGKVMLHAHIVLGKSDYTTIAGHLNNLRISGTCELYLTQINQTLTRSFDTETGLNLLDGD